MNTVFRVFLLLGCGLHTGAITFKVEQPVDLFDRFGIDGSKIFVINEEGAGSYVCRNLSIMFFWMFYFAAFHDKHPLILWTFLFITGLFVTVSCFFFGRIVYNVEKLLDVHSYQCSKEGYVVNFVSSCVGYFVVVLLDVIMMGIPILF